MFIRAPNHTNFATPCSTQCILTTGRCDFRVNRDWKELNVFPGRDGNSRGHVGTVNPKTEVTYDAVKTQYRNVLNDSGVDGEPILLSKVASSARRSAAQEAASIFSYDNAGGGVH